jgi:hypothetical protein
MKDYLKLNVQEGNFIKIMKNFSDNLKKGYRAVSNKIKTKNFFCVSCEVGKLSPTLLPRKTQDSFPSLLPCQSRVKAVAWYAGGLKERGRKNIRKRMKKIKSCDEGLSKVKCTGR